LKIAIQGELGSNSHLAALQMLGDIEILVCSVSADVVEALLSGRADAAVLPIENSLHGSVAEHYDLLLQNAIYITGESLLRVRHNLIAAPGVAMEDIRQVISHPVALSQCRRFLGAFPQATVVPFYDTAGSVKHLMAEGLRDTAGIAPELAAEQYGAQVLGAGIEDHAENYTRFHLLCTSAPTNQRQDVPHPASKMSVAFAVEHRPGTLVAALQVLRDVGVDLTKIESRPVPGRPWEYVFYVELRFTGEAMADSALAALQTECAMVKELGRYAAA
jgi:prephenate dehydratase